MRMLAGDVHMERSSRTGEQCESHAKYWWVFAVCCLMVVGVVCLLPTILQHWLNAEKPASAGEFGDQFGVANALFSGLAFSGVVVALFMQMHELRLQRKEMDETQEIMQQQQVSLARQNFDSMFFKSMDLLRAQRDTVRVSSNRETPTVVGVDAFSFVAEQLRSPRPAARAIESTIRKYELHFERELHDSLGAYMRILYRTMRLLADLRPDSELWRLHDRENYVKILRAQLSSSELVLIFYNCESKYGFNLKPLTEEFDLFDNLDPNWLAHESDASISRSSFVGVTSRMR